MNFKLAHTNINVRDLDNSIEFYKSALGLTVQRTFEQPEGKFKLVYLSDESNHYQIELTWLANREEPYQHGDNDLHLAFVTDDFEKAYEKHKEMNVICYENKAMGIYFIKDPDGYWLEVIPMKKYKN